MGWIRDPLAAMATPMTPERFQDRWEAFKGEPQHGSGIWGLNRSIAELEGSSLAAGCCGVVLQGLGPMAPTPIWAMIGLDWSYPGPGQTCHRCQ
jgi:hypothetical protein